MNVTDRAPNMFSGTFVIDMSKKTLVMCLNKNYWP
jgi:hypothetical protein